MTQRMTSDTSIRTRPPDSTKTPATPTNPTTTTNTTTKDTNTMYALLHDRPIADLSGFDRSTDATDATPVAVRTPQARCADGNGTLTLSLIHI